MKRKFNTPFVCVGHGGIGNEEQKILYKNPDLYIATNIKNKEWALKYFSKVEYIPIGVSLKTFEKNVAIKTEHQTFQHPIVLCVAAFVEFKRQNLLIDAMAQLNKGTLILIGRGEMKELLTQRCKEKLNGRFLIASCPYSEMSYFYSMCDIFSLPSQNEPFGIVFLEAMAANKPIVTVDDEARKSIVGPAGKYCDVENPKEYASTIEATFKFDWGQIPVKYVKENFNWELIADRYAELIGNMILRSNQ